MGQRFQSLLCGDNHYAVNVGICPALGHNSCFVAWKTRGMYLNELLRSIGNGVKDLSENGAAFRPLCTIDVFNPAVFLSASSRRSETNLALEIAEQLDSHALEPRLGDLLKDSCADVRRSALKYCLRLDNTSYHQESIMACCMDEEPGVELQP